MQADCPNCLGKGHVMGIDPNYPQDGNVALICQECRGRRWVYVCERCGEVRPSAVEATNCAHHDAYDRFFEPIA